MTENKMQSTAYERKNTNKPKFKVFVILLFPLTFLCVKSRWIWGFYSNLQYDFEDTYICVVAIVYSDCY